MCIAHRMAEWTCIGLLFAFDLGMLAILAGTACSPMSLPYVIIVRRLIRGCLTCG